jgi:hypothetical protein
VSDGVERQTATLTICQEIANRGVMERAMNDLEKRGIVLRALYELRRQPLIKIDQLDVGGMPIAEVHSILRQLEEKGLIEWTHKPWSGLGAGRITAD